jgi:hypothetical protein
MDFAILDLERGPNAVSTQGGLLRAAVEDTVRRLKGGPP